MVHNSCNMCTHGFLDMYTLSPRACGPQASDVHIRQTTHAHITTITYIHNHPHSYDLWGLVLSQPKTP